MENPKCRDKCIFRVGHEGEEFFHLSRAVPRCDHRHGQYLLFPTLPPFACNGIPRSVDFGSLIGSYAQSLPNQIRSVIRYPGRHAEHATGFSTRTGCFSSASSADRLTHPALHPAPPGTERRIRNREVPLAATLVFPSPPPRPWDRNS